MTDDDPPRTWPLRTEEQPQPLATAPHERIVRLCWREGDGWACIWGIHDDALGKPQWRADCVLTRSHDLPAEPTHWLP